VLKQLKLSRQNAFQQQEVVCKLKQKSRYLLTSISIRTALRIRFCSKQVLKNCITSVLQVVTILCSNLAMPVTGITDKHESSNVSLTC